MNTMFETNHTLEELREILRSLPEDLQEAIASMDTTKNIKTLGEKYGLHVDQIGKLNDEINAVMFGVRKITDLPNRLSSKITNLDKSEIQKLVGEINEKIFSKVRQSMESVHVKHEKEGVIHEKTHGPTPETDKDKIFEERMSKMFNLPQKKSEDEPTQVIEPKKYDRQDPYREPIE